MSSLPESELVLIPKFLIIPLITPHSDNFSFPNHEADFQQINHFLLIFNIIIFVKPGTTEDCKGYNEK